MLGLWELNFNKREPAERPAVGIVLQKASRAIREFTVARLTGMAVNPRPFKVARLP